MATKARERWQNLTEKSNPDKERAAKAARLAQDVKHTFATPEGRNTLRFIMQECGFLLPDAVADPKTNLVDRESTLYHIYRRSLYLKLRRMVSDETKIAVEIYDPVEDILA